jgi:SAM-dependent methyltransferase
MASKRVFYWLWRLLADSADSRLAERKERLLRGQPSGVVVELGAGLGHTIARYANAGITRLVLVEPNVLMHTQLRAAAAAAGFTGERLQISSCPGETLPLDSGSVDAVVSSLTLCSVREPLTVLREVYRVLKPGGRLYLLEHVRAPGHGAAVRLQRWVLEDTGLWGFLGDGCRLDRDTEATVRAVFPPACVQLERFTEPGKPAAMRHYIAGVAGKPAVVTAGGEGGGSCSL